MNTQISWTIVENGNTKDADTTFTSDAETADYIASAIAAMNEEQGQTGDVRAVRTDMVHGPRADIIANIRMATEDLDNANKRLANALRAVDNIETAAYSVHAYATVLANAALKLHEHDELLTKEQRGY